MSDSSTVPADNGSLFAPSREDRSHPSWLVVANDSVGRFFRTNGERYIWLRTVDYRSIPTTFAAYMQAAESHGAWWAYAGPADSSFRAQGTRPDLRLRWDGVNGLDALYGEAIRRIARGETPKSSAPLTDKQLAGAAEARRRSRADFRKAARDYPRGPERNAAYADQAQTFLDALQALGIDLDNPGDDQLAKLIRQGRGNIAAATHHPEHPPSEPVGIEEQPKVASTPTEREVPQIIDRPIEDQHVEHFTVLPAARERLAKRSEHSLVLRYRDWLESHGRRTICRSWGLDGGRGDTIVCDAYEEAGPNLVEAKAAATRDKIRMAIGQLADYGRFVAAEANKAVLTPDRPQHDLEDLLRSVDIAAIWLDDDRFVDNAGGRFV